MTFPRYDPAAQSTRELLSDWAAVMRELRDRDLIRTNNNPIGDIAEAIVHAHFGGERGSFVQAGWDVKTAEGVRLQVKALRHTGTGKRRNLSPIRDRDYDAVVAVIFREDFSIEGGLWISRELVERLFEHRPYVNGRIVAVTKALLTNPEVRHIDLSESLLDA